jgi:hypothetical protein
MSRVEKHRKYREEAAASISSNQKSIDDFKHEPATSVEVEPTKPPKIEAIDFSKPIRTLNEDPFKRSGAMESPFNIREEIRDEVKPNINIEQLRARAKNHSENELFDIDVAFTQLKKEHASPEMDTQLEVMNNLFSDKLPEYNSTMQLQQPNTANRQVLIDEDKLLDLLDERERKLKDELLKTEKGQQSKAFVEQEKERKEREKQEQAQQARLEKEQARLEKELAKQQKERKRIFKGKKSDDDVIKTPQTMGPHSSEMVLGANEQWAEESQSLRTRVKQHDYEFVNIEKNIRKNNAIIILLILILAGILGYLIYTFISVGG